MLDDPGVKLEQVSTTRDETTFSVSVDDTVVGNVDFVKGYEPRQAALGSYTALWAGPTLCVIDRRIRAMRCIERDDETHRIHSFENVWVVEGELNIELFDPESGTTLATYNHNEVITSVLVENGFVELRDFSDRRVILDARRALQVVQSRT